MTGCRILITRQPTEWKVNAPRNAESLQGGVSERQDVVPERNVTQVDLWSMAYRLQKQETKLSA
jgi:hypothetical protein